MFTHLSFPGAPLDGSSLDDALNEDYGMNSGMDFSATGGGGAADAAPTALTGQPAGNYILPTFDQL